eukprot:3635038-Alexandrium_andersonii.AAC.1
MFFESVRQQQATGSRQQAAAAAAAAEPHRVLGVFYSWGRAMKLIVSVGVEPLLVWVRACSVRACGYMNT